MNLKALSDTNLLTNTEKFVREERKLLTVVLNHFREIERRRLFSELGYKSLFDFAVRHLGYPDDQAYRRIAAMKLLKELPELEPKINSGEISLTHIGLAQSLFKQEKKIQQKEMSPSEKLSVFDKIANKPVRAAEKITLSLSSAPEIRKPDRINQVTEKTVEMNLMAPVEIKEKIERLKGMLAHTNPNLTLGELFDKLCDLGLEQWNPAKVSAPRKSRMTNNQSQAQIIRSLFEKANTQCESCGSVYALEVDHIYPKSKGGLSTIENLRILCRSCNQRAAIVQLGLNKMDRFVNAPPSR